MDWKLFPPTQSRVYSQEFSEKNRVSLEQLFHNLDALLERDTRDCLSKQLDGLLKNNARLYQVRPSFHRRQKTENFNWGYIGKALKCNTVSPMKSLSKEIDKPLELQVKSNRPHCDKSRSAAHPNDLLSSMEPTTPARISKKLSYGKNRNKIPLRLTSEGECNGGDSLPSNGWWQEQTFSDSGTETEAGVEETDFGATLNLEIKSDDFLHSCIARCTPESCQLPLFSSDVSETSHNDAKMQTQVGSCPSRISKPRGLQIKEENGANETCNFFQLTSEVGNEEDFMNETCLLPIPPPTTPVPTDKTSQTCFEDKPTLRFSRSLSLSSYPATFDDDLKLDRRELLQHRPNTTSRINYNKLDTSRYNYSSPNNARIIKKVSSKRSLENRNKVLCALPKMNLSKVNKTSPAVFSETVVERRPNTANVPVKLRLKHRSKSSAKFSDEDTRHIGADERVLPTTLNKSADASYSIMTPYMANIVWSVMDDEKVLL